MASANEQILSKRYTPLATCVRWLDMVLRYLERICYLGMIVQVCWPLTVDTESQSMSSMQGDALLIYGGSLCSVDLLHFEEEDRRSPFENQWLLTA